jgi:HEAT repeat protein
MDALLFPLIAVPIAFFAIWYGLSRRVDAWRHAARTAGLTHIREETSFGMLSKLHGEADGFSVTLQAYHHGKYDHGTRIIVDGRQQIPTSLSLRAEGFATKFDRAVGGKEIEVGDPGFDDEVYAQGPEEVLLPLLDDETRAAVRAVVALRAGRIVDGTVRSEIQGHGNPNALDAALSKLLRAARRLRCPDNTVERLVGIASDDYFPAVRRHCLDLLTRKYPVHERARQAFRDALRSADTEMRLIAAIALGDEGLSTLLEIAASATEDERLAARAIAALGPKLPLENAVAILDAAVTHERPATAHAAIDALTRIGGDAAVASLGRSLEHARGDLALATIAALGTCVGAGPEAPLLTALASDESELREAAAHALGRVGSPASVAPLHATVDAHMLDLGLRSAARQAIAAIQSRIPGASPGQVSLATGEAGHVSLTNDADAGRVALAPEDADAP